MNNDIDDIDKFDYINNESFINKIIFCCFFFIALGYSLLINTYFAMRLLFGNIKEFFQKYIKSFKTIRFVVIKM